MPRCAAHGGAAGHSRWCRRNRSSVREVPLRPRLRAARSAVWSCAVADSRRPLHRSHVRPQAGRESDRA